MHETNHIGIRVLTKDMMECSFSHTTAVMATIEKIRKTAYEVHDRFLDTLKKNPDQGMMEARGYNNAISILGSRGAGKTSVIMTLQHILKYGRESWEKQQYGDEHSENILMPILVPQDFSAGQSLLSWVIMQLIQKGEEIEKIITTEKLCSYGRTGAFVRWEDDKCRYPAYDPLRECMDKLTTSFELRYKKDSKYDVSNSEHVYEYMDEVRRDARLVLDMLKLISMIIDFYRYQRSKKVYENEVEQEPLLFFVIDDLDLAPERSQEVLNLVLRYLQHPNVVVICGWNQELFQSHLCMELLKTQGSLDSKLLDTNFGYDDVFMSRQRKRVAALDSARRLAMDNLKKAFPPALRYEIRSLSTEQRAWFPKKPDDSKLLVKTEDCFLNIIRDTLRECRRIGDSEPPKDVDFLVNDKGYILAYMRIFDNKARGMVNVYMAFQILKEYVQKWDKKNTLDITSHMMYLLDALLFSNTRFVPYRRGLRDLVKIDSVKLSADGNSTCIYYCDFKAVGAVMNRYSQMTSSVSDDISSDREYLVERQYNYFPSLIIDVYLLLNFVQNMLQYICNQPRYEHGGVEFSEALNEVNPPIRIVAKSDNLLSCLIASSGISKVNLFPTTEDFRFNLILLDAYEKNRFVDCHYDFAGSHSYYRLSNALVSIIGEKDCVLCKKNLQSFRQHDANWMTTIENLFGTLRFTNDNIKRLARYRSLKLQNNEFYGIQEQSNLRDMEQKELINIDEWNHSSSKQTIKFQEIDDLVYSIRRIYSFIRQWKNISYEVDRTAKNADSLMILISKTQDFIDRFKLYAKCEKPFLCTAQYRKDVDDYRTSHLQGLQSSEDAEQLLDAAIKCAEENIDVLLENIRRILQLACYRAWKKCDGPREQFRCLMDVSKKIAKITEQLSLGEGAWTAEDENVVAELMTIFRNVDAHEPYDLAKQLVNLGPRIGETKRNVYNEKLNRLKQWVNVNSSHFSPKEMQKLDLGLGNLQRAYGKIRRYSPGEEMIQGVFRTFGVDIANLCAHSAVEEELLKDKTLLVEGEVTWPVVVAIRDKFEVWGTIPTEQELF